MTTDDRRPALDAEALESLLEVTRALARPLDIETMLERVIEAGRNVLDADRGTVFLYDGERDELVSKVATGTGELRVPASRGIVGECARTRQVINVGDCYADSRFNREVDKKTGYRTRCLMAVPLIGHDDSLEGVLQVLNSRAGVFSERDERIATALGGLCAVALQRTRLLGELVEKERMKQELSVARRIQQRVLPQVMPAVAGYELHGWCRTADETGGDIFDIIDRGDRVVLLLGDATGHGIGPALSVTQVRAMLRMCVRFGGDLDGAAQHINDQLAEDLSSRRFVTALLGVLDPRQHSVTYHAAGQGPLLHYHVAEDRVEWLDSTTRPLGVFAGIPLGRSRTLELAPGDLFLVASDGIFEYEGASGEQYGEARLADAVRARRDAPAAALVEAIVEDVAAFAAGSRQADDMTILAVRRHPGPGPEIAAT